MAFIIRKKLKNKVLHYLVESVRVGGGSKHKPILTMGEHQTLDLLLASIEEKINRIQEDIQLYEECHSHVESGKEPKRKEHTWSLEYLARIIGYRRIRLEDKRKEHERISELKEKYFSKTSSGNSKS